MNKKLWVSLAAVAIIVPVIIVLVVFFGGGSDDTPVSLNGGGEVTKTSTDGVLKYTSEYGYSVEYKDRFEIDDSMPQFDFYVHDETKDAQVGISVSENNGEYSDITSQEDWESKMPDFGKCNDFTITTLGGARTCVAHYYRGDTTNNLYYDILIAVMEGEQYCYTYAYTATQNATSADIQYLSDILYTFNLEE